MSAGRIILLVFGIICVMASLGLFIGGGVTLAVEDVFKDDQGYYSTGPISIETDTAAVVTQPAYIEIDGGWPEPNNLATLKIEAESVSGKPVFIGIARSSAVDNYLKDTNYSEVRDFSKYPDQIYYQNFSGDENAPSPVDQNFWVASSTGTGNQTLEWEVESGSYTIVLMNADGTSQVEADVILAAKIPPVVRAVGIGLIVGGIIFLVGGAVMLFFAAKGW